MAIASALFALALALPATAQREVVMELKQFHAHHVFFHPAAEGLCFTKVNGKIRTNAWVFGSHPGGASSDGRVRSIVDGWIDSRGHVHTVGVLQRQLAFMGRYLSFLMERGAPRPGDCDFDGCLLSRGRTTPVRVRNVAPTGILDRETLLLPYYALALRYEELIRKHESRRFPPGALHDFWQEKLIAARDEIEKLRNAPAWVPWRRQVPPPAGATRQAPGGKTSGIEIEIWEMPWLRSPIEVGPKTSCHRLARATPTSEEAVEESADPSMFDPATISLISVLEASALAAVNDAELIAEELAIEAP